MGNKAFRAGKYKQAAEFYSKAIARNPNVATFWANRSLAELRLERWEEALRDASESLARDNGSAKAHCRLGVALYQLDRLDESLIAFNKAASIDADCAELAFKRNVVAALGKRKTGTLRRIVTHATVAEEAEEARKKAVGNFKRGDYTKAVEAFTAAIKQAPHHGPFYSHRALAYIKLAQYDDAISDCDRAIELDPLCVHAWARKGSAYAGKQDYEAALQCFDQAIEINPKHPEVQERGRVERLAKAARRKSGGKTGDADKLPSDGSGTAASSARRRLSSSALSSADLLAPQGKPALTPQALRAAVNNLHVSAQDLWVAHKKDRAIDVMKEACRMDPKFATSFVVLATMYLDCQRYREALDMINKVLAEDESTRKDANVHVRRCRALLGLNRLNEAMEELRVAEDLEPSNAELAVVRKSLKRSKYVPVTSDAVNSFQAWIAVKRADASTLMQDGNFAEAARVWGELIGIEPNNPDNFTGRAAARLKLEDAEGALADCHRALGLSQTHAKAWARKGMAHLELGQMAEAVEAFDMTEKLDPTRPELKFRKKADKVTRMSV